MYSPIIASLGYILSPDRNKTLLIHRNARPDDLHFGKYNGLGGKMEPGEDIYTCLTREIREEAGIECQQARLRGTINWQGFGRQGEDWFGFIFLVERFSGTPKADNEEGSLSWEGVESLLSLPLWEGDRYFIPLVFDDDPRIFHGSMPYDGDRPLGWSFQRI